MLHVFSRQQPRLDSIERRDEVPQLPQQRTASRHCPVGLGGGWWLAPLQLGARVAHDEDVAEDIEADGMSLSTASE
jgi:hypothetical protein